MMEEGEEKVREMVGWGVLEKGEMMWVVGEEGEVEKIEEKR